MLRNSAYTPYPEDVEMLLKGDIELLVLGVDPKLKIGNGPMAGYRRVEEICVVYLYLNE